MPCAVVQPLSFFELTKGVGLALGMHLAIQSGDMRARPKVNRVNFALLKCLHESSWYLYNGNTHFCRRGSIGIDVTGSK